MFDKETYLQRRSALKAGVGSGVILLLGNEESSMNYKDNVYPFRQDSSFLYFVGIDKPNVHFVVDIDNDEEVLFGDEATIDEIIWIGRPTSVAELAANAGISKVLPAAQIAHYLSNILSKQRVVHYLPPYRGEHYLQISAWLNRPAAAIATATSEQLIRTVVGLRSIKSALEIREIERAIDVTADMQLAAMQQCRAGQTEAELAGKLQAIAIAGGGNLSFPTILTTHGEVLHNHYGDNVIPSGATVLCDCGAETASHYGGDLTRTFPVDKTFTNRERELYEIVLNAQQSAAAALKPGKLFLDVHHLACEKLTEGLIALGIMKGDPKEAVAAGAHTLFFQCGLGHMMGLDIHDMENLGEQYVGYTDQLNKSTEFGLKSLRLGRALEPGFVVTVEPGLYFIPVLTEMWAAGKKHDNFINYDKALAFMDAGGTRIEEDFLVTETGARLLGKPLAITVQEVESTRQAG
ncbi:M24 family metallopeptidase [Segetibacter sp. 3557_3]|uniref:aminopeptidase P family protein n=1 Tax=Segetibacter sp. 3557_3 TaxID=2547429 RepID=UPI00105861CD|nr:aminopeptidase P family protein [Segetibacter sp. 3557_3]TDH24160.1 M24 family metallopeptidase [Segetibacter sp. 3557_3]